MFCIALFLLMHHRFGMCDGTVAGWVTNNPRFGGMTTDVESEVEVQERSGTSQSDDDGYGYGYETEVEYSLFYKSLFMYICFNECVLVVFACVCDRFGISNGTVAGWVRNNPRFGGMSNEVESEVEANSATDQSDFHEYDDDSEVITCPCAGASALATKRGGGNSVRIILHCFLAWPTIRVGGGGHCS